MFSSLTRLSAKGTQRRFAAGGKGALLLAAISLLPIACPSFAIAGTESDPNLVKLELKFFEHDYPKEDMTTRLERLEKLVFGEAKSGDPAVRLKNLVAAVPNLDQVDADQSASSAAKNDATASSDSDSGSQSTAQAPPGRRTPDRHADEDLAQREQTIENSSQYPQVTAMEKRIFGRDYTSEPLAKRLERLELKEFGKVSYSNDLSERVDRLKERTGIDLAHNPPPGSDWSDDDDSPMGGNSLSYVPAETTPFSSSSRSTSDFNGSSRRIGGGSSGGYGMGSTSSSVPPLNTGSHGGSYGYNPPRIASADTPRVTPPSLVPQPAPDVVHEPSLTPPAAMGLNQRVAMLENDLFNKTFPNDTLPQRVARLESTVFPGKRTPADMSLPERVARLVDVVGPDASAPAPSTASNSNRRVAQRPSDDDIMNDPAMPKPAPPRTGGGLSKIINGLGNLISGGYGSYAMNSNLVTDPNSGMLIDMYSGNIIDPRTGAVVGNRAAGLPAVPYGGVPLSGFNNGLSPIGTPYGMGMGGTGMGMRFGGGRMGIGSGMGFGSGIGFGTGFGGMGMGVWP